MTESSSSSVLDARGTPAGWAQVKACLKATSVLWPVIVGLAVGRCSIIVPTYASYVSSDDGIFTDGATLFFSLLAFILVCVIAIPNLHLEKKQVRRIMIGTVAAQCALMLVAGFVQLASGPVWARLCINGVNTLFGVLIFGYWLRYVRGARLRTVTVVLFSALALSEVELLACAFLSGMWDNVAAAVLLLAEFPLMRRARRAPLAWEIDTGGPQLLENVSKDRTSIARFLISNGLCIAALSLAIGLMRGFPAGLAIPFSLEMRVVCFVAIVAVCAIVIVAVAGRTWRFPFALAMWGVMLLTVTVVLFLYAFLPDRLDAGAAATTALNAFMVVFDWVLIVAFMSFGWRDPYYYLRGGIVVFLFFRAVARISEPLLAAWGVDEPRMLVLISILSFASVLVLTGAYVGVLLDERDRVLAQRQSRVLHAVMGIDAEKKPQSLEELRTEAMEANVRKLGERFLLSDREIEVLTLYAMGHTQRKVAEELVISPETVHAHIKRIYAKTGLHSRQAILDFVAQYSE